jgi:vacuolar-type H+-ATPase subunit H
MASEAVKKILEAEALSDKKNADARRQRDDIISTASGKSSLAIQKKISEATSQAAKIRSAFDVKLKEYEKKSESKCSEQINNIRQLAEKNMDSAVNEIISRYF